MTMDSGNATIGVLGLLLVVGGWLLHSLTERLRHAHERLDEVEANHSELRVKVAEKCVTRDEHKDSSIEIKRILYRIEQRMDRISMGPAAGSAAAPGDSDFGALR